jgi:hypothetical protein
MFDVELASVVAIFAGIAALIAYINERSKRKIKTSTKPFVLKKMPGSIESQPQGSDLEEWNFPQPTAESRAPSPSVSIPEAPPTVFVPIAATPAYASPLYTGQSYQEIASPKPDAPQRTPKGARTPHPRLGTQAHLRESIVTMTILGPCRALAPFQDRE